MTSSIVVHVCRTLVVSGLLASTMSGQEISRRSVASPPLIRTTFAVVEAIKYPNADGVIIRRAGVAPHDIVLIKRDVATTDFVAEAFHELAVARTRFGDTASKDMVIRVQRPGVKRGGRRVASLALVMSKSAPLHDVKGIGRVPSVEVALPSQHARIK